MRLVSVVVFTSVIIYTKISRAEELDADNGNISLYANFTCGGRWSCQFVPQEHEADTPMTYLRDRNCACDSVCSYFNDCCSDSTYNNVSISPALQAIPRKYVLCMRNRFIYVYNPVYQVAACPEFTNQNVSELCEADTGDESDIMLMVPVTGVKSRMLYKNFYCAVCHNEEYEFWIPSVECGSFGPLGLNETSTFSDTLDNVNCRVTMLPPNNDTTFHPCHLSYDSEITCLPPYNETKLNQLCQSSKGASKLVFAVTVPFKNKYCAQCNFKEPACISESKYSLPPIGGMYSFSILFDLNTGTGSKKVGVMAQITETREEKQNTCTNNEVYDLFVGQCRTVICNTPLVVQNGKCIFPNLVNRNISEMHNESEQCARVKLNESEFTMFENRTLLEIASGRHFDESEFYINNTFAYVCTNFTQNYTQIAHVQSVIRSLTYSYTQIVVTFVCMLLSLISLFTTAVVYCSISSLRNLPGKCVISLCVCQFLAYLLLLLAPSAEPNIIASKSVAILLHYFFLGTFCWMNVLSTNIFLTFSKSFENAGSQSAKRFVKYSLYAWLTPLLPVLIAIIVDCLPFDTTHEIMPNYGGGICWITNKIGLLVFFAVPLLILLLLNLVCFVVSVKTIFIAKRHSTKYLGKEEKGTFFIYVKLFIIMGLTWVFGFLATLVSQPAMWYIYIFFNALQGLFILTSFVLNRRVLRLMKTKVSQSWNMQSQGQTMTSMYTITPRVESEPNINSASERRGQVYELSE